MGKKLASAKIIESMKKGFAHATNPTPVGPTSNPTS
jgi:hypothetical protein